jgi:hypothetical protein
MIIDLLSGDCYYRIADRTAPLTPRKVLLDIPLIFEVKSSLVLVILLPYISFNFFYLSAIYLSLSSYLLSRTFQYP